MDFCQPSPSFTCFFCFFYQGKPCKFTKDFLTLPNPLKPGKSVRKRPFKQGNSLPKIYQGNLNNQGKEGRTGNVLKSVHTYVCKKWFLTHFLPHLDKNPLCTHLRWAKTRVLKTDTRVSKRAFKNTSVSKWFLDLFYAMVDSVSVRCKNASVSKKCL